MRSSIVQDKIDDIGIINQAIREINLKADKKRFWIGELKSLKDIVYCHSAPWNANQIADEISKERDVEWEDEREERYEPESDL